jgi:hypothetical protein
MSDYEKKERIVKFYTTLATYVKENNKAKQILHGLDAQGEIHRGNKKVLEQIAEQRKQAIQVKDVTEKLAVEYAGSRNMATTEELLSDLEARISQHETLNKGLNEMEAQFELAVSMGEFDETVPGMTRADAEKQITSVRERAEKQLALADALIPARSTIIEIASA